MPALQLLRDLNQKMRDLPQLMAKALKDFVVGGVKTTSGQWSTDWSKLSDRDKERKVFGEGLKKEQTAADKEDKRQRSLTVPSALKNLAGKSGDMLGLSGLIKDFEKLRSTISAVKDVFAAFKMAREKATKLRNAKAARIVKSHFRAAKLRARQPRVGPARGIVGNLPVAAAPGKPGTYGVLQPGATQQQKAPPFRAMRIKRPPAIPLVPQWKVNQAAAAARLPQAHIPAPKVEPYGLVGDKAGGKTELHPEVMVPQTGPTKLAIPTFGLAPEVKPPKVPEPVTVLAGVGRGDSAEKTVLRTTMLDSQRKTGEGPEDADETESVENVPSREMREHKFVGHGKSPPDVTAPSGKGEALRPLIRGLSLLIRTRAGGAGGGAGGGGAAAGGGGPAVGPNPAGMAGWFL